MNVSVMEMPDERTGAVDTRRHRSVYRLTDWIPKPHNSFREELPNGPGAA